MGRSSDGPRTTGDINILGLSLILYQVWMYLAVFNTPFLFTASRTQGGNAPAGVDVFQPSDTQLFIILAFLAASAVCLGAIAAFSTKVTPFIQNKGATALAALFCIAGTACAALNQAEGGIVALVGGILMGGGASLFLVRWGHLFAQFRFATTVINTGLSLPISLGATCAVVNWVPAPFSGIIALVLPLCFLLVFWNHSVADTSESFSHLWTRSTIGYCVRLGICLAVFGVVLGATHTLCIYNLISARDVATDLVLIASCVAGAIVIVVALSISQKESRWDWLFRVGLPIVAVGCACLPCLIGPAHYFGAFIFALGLICLGMLLWVLLASLSSELNASFVYGMGVAVLNLASMGGVGLAFGVLGASASSPAAFSAALDSAAALQTQVSLALLALALCVLVVVGYALLPRYYELKTILSSTLNDIAAEALVADEVSQGVASSATPVAAQAAANSVPANEVLEQLFKEAEEAMSATSDLPSVITAEVDSSLDVDLPADEGSPVETREEKGSFMRRCDEISQEYHLSNREQEVLTLLAKGHNASFILEKLCISRSTAKTHINHIYKKLGIHTQQELLNMVEERKRNTLSERWPNGLDRVASLGAMGAAVPQDTEALRETILQAHINHSTKQRK